MPPRSLLVIRPGGIGDAALLAPMLNVLKSAYPQARLTVLAERRNCGAFALVPAVDKILCYDKPRELCAALRGKYDAVIDTEQWHRLSAVVARLAGGTMSVGFATNERRRLFTHTLPYSHDRYEAESFLDLLAPFDIEPPPVMPPFLTVPTVARAKADELLQGVGGKFVAIFPGASIPEREWGASNFRLLAERLAGEGKGVVVVGGGEDVADGEEIVSSNGLNLAGKTSLAETAAVIGRAELLVSGDSGVLHLAVGLGTPTVSLFGPGIRKKWGPRGEHDMIIDRGLPCSPCTRFGYTPQCREGASCIAGISADEVARTVDATLARGHG